MQGDVGQNFAHFLKVPEDFPDIPELEKSLISFSLQEEHLAEEARAVTYIQIYHNSLITVLEKKTLKSTKHR